MALINYVPTTDFDTPADGAKFMAAYGIPQVVLTSPLDTKYNNPGKNPCIGGDNWPSKATTDPTKIDELAARFKASNFGSLAKHEEGGFFVIERDGDECLKDFEAMGGEKDFGARLINRSSRGYHYWFRHTAESLALIKNIGQIVTDFSLREHNEQCVSPGSWHASGVQYKNVLNNPPAAPSPKLLEWLQIQATKDKTARGNKAFPRDEKGLIPQGHLYDAIMSEIGSLRHRGYDDEGTETAIQHWVESNCAGPIDWKKVEKYVEWGLSKFAQDDPLADSVFFGGKLAGTVNPDAPSPIPGMTNEQVVKAAEKLTAAQNQAAVEKTAAIQSKPSPHKKIHLEYDMTADEIAEQEEAEYPVYRLTRGAGPDFDEDSLYGPVGEVARKMSLYNESHVAAIYLNLLVSLGNLMGQGPHFNVSKTRHSLNEFLAIIGDTSVGRKGTGSDEVKDFLNIIAAEWMTQRNKSGFGSPQGIISQIRDDVTFQKLNKKTGIYEPIFKKGVDDKRLCIRENELSNILKLMSDPKTRADELLRNGWDGAKLENWVAGTTDVGENKSLFCTKPHLSIIGYSTASLLKSTMPIGADNSGSGNRFLFAYTQRLKLVPSGGPSIDWGAETLDFRGEKMPFVVYFYEMIREAQQERNIPLAASATRFWHNMYLKLERDQWDGFLGKMTSRGAAHIRRLATIFALIDREPVVSIRHLEAAQLIWWYSRQSVRHIFVGYSAEGERILQLAHERGAEGITDREVHALYNRNKTGEYVQSQLKELVKGGWLTDAGDKHVFKKW